MSNPKLEYFSYFNSADGINRPIKGTGAIAIPTPTFGAGYNPGQNALYIDTNLASGQRAYINATVNPEMCIEFWMKPNGWSLSNTTMTGNTYCAFFESYNIRNAPLKNYFLLHASNGTGIFLLLQDDDSAAEQLTITNATIPADTWGHWTVVISKAGVFARVYQNGIKIGETTTANKYDFTTASQRVYMGMLSDPTTGDYGAQSYFQNVKFWTYAKTDFSDRFQPRFGMNDQRVII